MLFIAPSYRNVVAPDSTTGIFDQSLTATLANSQNPSRDILVLGDSRIYSGFDADTAGRAEPGLHFINAGVPGTTPRCWTIFDRALDPDARRYRAVVVPVDTYSDDDGAIGALDASEHYFDLHYIVYAADPSEIVRVARSFRDSDRRYQAFFDLLLRGPLLREDVQNFVTDPKARFDALAAQRVDAPASRLRDGDMTALRVDFTQNTLVEPPLFPSSLLDMLQRQVLAIAKPSPSYAAYREQWLGAIVRRYASTGTPVIFVRIPTRPVHRNLPPPPSGTLATFAAGAGVKLIPQDAYVALERPELFVDPDHLNRVGAIRFTSMLAADVATALETMHARPSASRAPPRAPSVAFASLLPGAAIGFGTPMRFQSFEFAIFFAIVVATYYAVKAPRLRRGILLAASWYFYARWNASYLVVLIALSIGDWAFGLGIERTAGTWRRAMLAAGVTANVAFLATVKYSDFFSASFASLSGAAGDPWALRLLVPVGISFHTFQSISYLVDVSRGKTRSVKNFFDYALYLAFFPQLLAGPIVRAATFFGELFGRAPAVPERFSRGLFTIVLGLFKKSVLADRFAPAAETYFGSIGTHPGALPAWGAMFAFAMQIYFDFSGYSDIAIGCARVLGFEFPENFHRPYLAWSITEFWRRWHMTLSAWLRDYLYIPLGGNRRGHLATYRNLILTMLIGGLWHGANWTFVAWGAYHGIALAVERAFGVSRSHQATPPAGTLRIARTVLTFGIVAIGWVFFRAQSFDDAFATLHAMFAGGSGSPIVDAATMLLAALVFAVEIGAEMGIARTWRSSVLIRAGTLTALLLGLELASFPGAAAEFVYFKF